MADIVDSYVEANQDNLGSIFAVHPSADADRSASGQSFTGNGQNLYSAKFYLKVATGTPGNLIARLYAHSGTFGSSSVPTGAALDSSDTVVASGIGGTLTLVEFTGFSGYTLVNATKYCIVAECYDGTWDASNYVNDGRDVSSPAHGGNWVYYINSAWTYLADYDQIFYVYGTTPSAFIPRITGII